MFEAFQLFSKLNETNTNSLSTNGLNTNGLNTALATPVSDLKRFLACRSTTPTNPHNSSSNFPACHYPFFPSAFNSFHSPYLPIFNNVSMPSNKLQNNENDIDISSDDTIKKDKEEDNEENEKRSNTALSTHSKKIKKIQKNLKHLEGEVFHLLQQKNPPSSPKDLFHRCVGEVNKVIFAYLLIKHEKITPMQLEGLLLHDSIKFPDLRFYNAEMQPIDLLLAFAGPFQEFTQEEASSQETIQNDKNYSIDDNNISLDQTQQQFTLPEKTLKLIDKIRVISLNNGGSKGTIYGFINEENSGKLAGKLVAKLLGSEHESVEIQIMDFKTGTIANVKDNSHSPSGIHLFLKILAGTFQSMGGSLVVTTLIGFAISCASGVFVLSGIIVIIASVVIGLVVIAVGVLLEFLYKLP
ncbi:MAG: hypothetical protein LBT98_01420 [Puniceicoccales bacterium]|nr:hypothetical protein [Puniceicoccales bacterium]